MTARYMSYQTRHRSPRLVAPHALLASHKRRDTRQTKLPSLCAGLFCARCQTRTNVRLCRYPVDFKRFYRVGSGRDPSTPCDKSGQSLDLHLVLHARFPQKNLLPKKIIKTKKHVDLIPRVGIWCGHGIFINDKS